MSDDNTWTIGPIRVMARRDAEHVPPVCDGALGYSILPHVAITFGEPGGLLHQSIGISSRADALAAAAALIEAADVVWSSEQGGS